MALYAEQVTEDVTSDDILIEDVSGGANVLFFSGFGTWDGATVTLLYVQENGQQVALTDWTFTDDFAITVPVKDTLVFQVAVVGAGVSTNLSIELK